MIYRLAQKSMIGEAYMKELYLILKSCFLDTCVTPVGTPSSSSALGTLTHGIALPHTSRYIGTPLGHMNPS